MTAGIFTDWQVGLGLAMAFVVVLLLIFRVGRDKDVRRIRVGLFVERQKDSEEPPQWWPVPPPDPTLYVPPPEEETKPK